MAESRRAKLHAGGVTGCCVPVVVLLSVVRKICGPQGRNRGARGYRGSTYKISVRLDVVACREVSAVEAGAGKKACYGGARVEGPAKYAVRYVRSEEYKGGQQAAEWAEGDRKKVREH